MQIIKSPDRKVKVELACSLLTIENVCPLTAVQLILDLIKHCGDKDKNRLPKVRRVIRMASDLYDQEKHSVSFAQAVDATLETKSHRRSRTLQEIKYISHVLLKKCPALKKKMVRSITPNDCRKYLETSFKSIRQRYKARIIMSGIFTVAYNRGWCSDNPIKKIEVPVFTEREIKALNPDEISSLIKTACHPKFRECLPAVALMLYAGIRPFEVMRLSWDDISLEEKVISIRPSHSKTGGTRHVTIMKPLEKILSYFSCMGISNMQIAPKNWQRKWGDLRKAAGWSSKNKKWEQDSLRHTFASYHAKHFQDYERLQWEMGHHSSVLLRTRYLNMTGVTRKQAARFWQDTSFIQLD